MGTFQMAGATTSQASFAVASAEISLSGGIVFGVVILLIIVAGFLILNYRNDESKRDDDRVVGINKGIAKNKLDN